MLFHADLLVVGRQAADVPQSRHHGRARILSQPAVGAMTRKQLPSIGARLGAIFHREASFGYGWIVEDNEK